MTIESQLSEYISNHMLTEAGDGPIAPDQNLLLSGMIDSLGIMQLVNFIEENYGFEVEAGEVTINNFKTIDSIANFVALKSKNGQ